MVESDSSMDSQENIRVKDEFSVNKNIIMALTIFNIVSLGFASWLFVNFFSLMGKDTLSGTFWEKVYDPVVNIGLLFTPFIVLIVHVMGILLLKRFGVLSIWWLMNYLPLIIVSLIAFVILSFWLPVILIILLILAILLVPLFRFEW